jgi:type IV pilus assembly protein PilP
MGKNDGRIAEITPTQINLIEIVPDSRVGYVEKPASLVAAVS